MTIDTNPGSAAAPDGGDGLMSRLLAQNWWALALRGLAAILFGFIALIAPGVTLLSLALFFAAYLLVDGILAIVASARAARAQERWLLLAAEGLLNILMSGIIFIFPAGAVLAFVLVTAAWAVITGGVLIAAAYKLRRGHGRIWMALAGIVSILFGAALVVAPLIGAVVLTWWLGGYALAFGVMMIVLAFRLRRRKDETIGAS